MEIWFEIVQCVVYIMQMDIFYPRVNLTVVRSTMYWLNMQKETNMVKVTKIPCGLAEVFKKRKIWKITYILPVQPNP